MADPTIALAVPWCPWIPERVEAMARLRYALGIVSDYDKYEPQEFTSSTSGPTGGYREFGEKAPNDVWSEAVFHWLAETGADWAAEIQEDAIIPPNFWACVRAVIAAAPEGTDILGLHVCHPFAEHLAREGVRTFTTTDALVGVCWLVRGPVMREFVEWRRTQLVEGWRTPTAPKGLPSITEDTMLAMFAAATGRRILHTIPAIVDHDVSMLSVHGNDDHQNRRPKVRWDDPAATWTLDDLAKPEFWAGGTSIPHIGRFYDATPVLLKRWVKGFTEADLLRVKQDDGQAVAVGMKYRMLAKAYREPKYRLFIGTPYRGGLHPEYVASIFALQRMLGLDVHHELSLDVRHEHEEIVRVRSRMVRLAYESNCTHLVFADSDHAFSPEVVLGMLKTGRDFVQAPYLRRDGRGYTIRPIEEVRRLGSYQPEHISADGTVEIEGTGFGLTILSRACLETMVEHYRGTGLDYLDVTPGHPPAVTAALFQTIIRDMVFMSEDMSFAQRWRDIGGAIHMYVGDGVPIAHFGEAKYQGRIEDLGFERRTRAA